MALECVATVFPEKDALLLGFNTFGHHCKRSLVITETVIGMGKRLGVKVVAEGIESDATLQWLRERDCDFGQGYLFGAPMDAGHFEQWFRRTQPQGAYH